MLGLKSKHSYTGAFSATNPFVFSEAFSDDGGDADEEDEENFSDERFSDSDDENEDEPVADEAARQEAMAIFADLARDVLAGLTVDSIWQIEVTDEAGKPVFRLGLISESLAQEGADMANAEIERPPPKPLVSARCLQIDCRGRPANEMETLDPQRKQQVRR